MQENCFGVNNILSWAPKIGHNVKGDNRLSDLHHTVIKVTRGAFFTVGKFC